MYPHASGLQASTVKPGQEMVVDIHAPAKSQQPAALNRAEPIAKVTRRPGPARWVWWIERVERFCS